MNVEYTVFISLIATYGSPMLLVWTWEDGGVRILSLRSLPEDL